MNEKKNTQGKKLIALDKDSGLEKEFLVKALNHFQLDGQDLDAEIEQTADGFTFLKIGEISYPVEIISQRQNEYEVTVNGISYNFSVETPFSLTRKKMLASQMNESTVILLKAPMPGKILEVLVKAGDTVNAGDTLLILEAMKMQNAILSSTKAIVKKVHARAGDTTSKSDLLIELEKE